VQAKLALIKEDKHSYYIPATTAGRVCAKTQFIYNKGKMRKELL